jgi:anaerobic magnesium-protoporphyrin IX monomethyl ester cyclase
LILLVEPISKNTGMYVPAYPLPLMEIASFAKAKLPTADIQVVSFTVDYGLPLTKEGRAWVYEAFLKDVNTLKPKGVGISCTAIAQAEEVIYLSEMIKQCRPETFIFLGGYFPTLYYEEIFSKTQAVDSIVIGEGEIPAYRIIEHLENNRDPRQADVPNLVWHENGKVRWSLERERFDPENKEILNLSLLRHPHAYDILPYAFSRGCPYRCTFCMESYIRPERREVPPAIVQKDLMHLLSKGWAKTLLVSDALFKSFDLLESLKGFEFKVNFETRGDTMVAGRLSRIADLCGIIALGFESASYSTLRRMNKVRDRGHYEKYLSNSRAIFKEAVKNKIPIMVFMIAGFPGDTEEDLKESLEFARVLSRDSGEGGHVFKIGECQVYPKTRLQDLADTLPGVVYDRDGIFGLNVVRKPSASLDFSTVLHYMNEIFGLSNETMKLQTTLLKLMPFFRLPVQALADDLVPESCFRVPGRSVLDVRKERLASFREVVPKLIETYRPLRGKERSTRILPF